MGLTVSGYFTIDELAAHLELVTKEHLGSCASKYGAYFQRQVQPDANTRFWLPEDFLKHQDSLLSMTESGSLVEALINKRLFDEFYGVPKSAVTVSGTVEGISYIETHALDLTRAEDFAQGINIPDTPGVRKNFLVWNYLEGQHAYQLERLWLPERDAKLQVLQERRSLPPFR